MKTLIHGDVSRCSNEDCPLNNSCRRHLQYLEEFGERTESEVKMTITELVEAGRVIITKFEAKNCTNYIPK